MYRNPLEQFIINDIFTISLPIVSKKVSLTNIGLYLIVCVVIILIISGITIKNSRVTTREKGLLIKQSLYDTVHKIVKDQVGISNEIYLPYIYTLFVLVLTSNLIGLIPYNFTSTSHLEMRDDSVVRSQ